MDDKTLFFSQLPKKAADFAAAFKRQFKCATNSAHNCAYDWLLLIFSPGKKNCTSAAGFHPSAHSQALNHFLTDSTFDFWDWQYEMGKVAFQRLKGNCGNQAISLVIDESSFLKKGSYSCGVARQYAGTVGKVDNCQVGVFAALTNGAHHCLVQSRLHLPSEWIDNEERLDKARVPEYARTYASKIEICKEMVFNIKGQGIHFEWVNFDSFYGRDQKMLAEFNQAGICFVADIPSNTLVLERKEGTQQRVDEMASHWQLQDLTLRRVAGGDLKTQAVMKKVWIKSGGATPTWISLWLLVRKDAQGKMHYVLSNYKGNNLQKLAQMHGRRYWIEKSFREAKDSLGMDQYQIRTYPGWHRWMGLIMMAMLFILTQALLPDPVHKRLTFEAVVKFKMLFLFGPIQLFEKQLFQWYVDHPDKWIALNQKLKKPNLTK